MAQGGAHGAQFSIFLDYVIWTYLDMPAVGALPGTQHARRPSPNNQGTPRGTLGDLRVERRPHHRGRVKGGNLYLYLYLAGGPRPIL